MHHLVREAACRYVCAEHGPDVGPATQYLRRSLCPSRRSTAPRRSPGVSHSDLGEVRWHLMHTTSTDGRRESSRATPARWPQCGQRAHSVIVRSLPSLSAQGHTLPLRRMSNSAVSRSTRCVSGDNRGVLSQDAYHFLASRKRRRVLYGCPGNTSAGLHSRTTATGCSCNRTAATASGKKIPFPR